ncbi:MAG: Cupin domain protein [Methanoregula sp. PtaU1.Bin051]|nr:MAG: Cupin domain protein [Methanoregula sp. PtaU1.Bin051]
MVQTGMIRVFDHHSATGYRESLPGISQKTLVHGKNTLMAEFRLQKESVLPRHSHPHEQTGYLVSGHMTLHIGDEEAKIRPGDSWNIPSGMEHGAEVHEDSVAIEVFYPVRDDYLC